MRRGSTTLLIGLFALVSAYLVAFLWLSRDTAPPIWPETPPADPASEPIDELPPPLPRQGDQVDYGPRVWIEIVQTGRYEASAGALVRVRRGENDLPGAAATVIGGVGQDWPVADPRPGQALVRVVAPDGIYHRQVHVQPAERPTEVVLGAVTTLRGTVLDAAQKPVVAARVWTGGAPEDEVRTDDKGEFAVEVPAGSGVPVVVRADGKAWACKFVDVPPLGGATSLVLAAETVLTVQLMGNDQALPDARVAVVPVGDSFTTEQLQYPFFAQGLLADFVADARGRVVIAGLPRGGSMGVSVGGAGVVATTPQRVELLRATASTALATGPGVPCRGTVVDHDGKPLAGAFVWCWSTERVPEPRHDGRWLLSRAADVVGASFVTTGEDGTFDMLVPDTATCVLSVSSEGGPRLVRELERRARLGLRCPLPHSLEKAQLRVPPIVAGKAWPLRIDPGDSMFRVVAKDREFVHPLPQPVLVALRIRTAQSGASWSDARIAKDFMVCGPSTLPRAVLVQ